MVTPKEHQMIVDDLLVTYYTVNGPQKSPTLVFLHGWGSTSQLWFTPTQELSKSYTLLYVDLPGFGRSQRPEIVFGLAQYSKIVEKLLGKLEVKNPVVVGHSFGASVALTLAQSASNIEALILVDSAGLRPRTFKKSIIQQVAWIARPFFHPQCMQSVRKKIYALLGSSDYIQADGIMQKIYTRIMTEDLTSLIPQISQPVLLLWGEHDTDTPLSDAYQMNQLLPESTLHILPKAGHFSFLDNSKAFVHHLKDFLQNARK